MNTENRTTVSTKSGVRLAFALDPAMNTPVFLGRVDDIENTDEHISTPRAVFNKTRRKAASILRKKKAAREKTTSPKEELRQLTLL